MTARWEVELETERVHFDGAWLTREELSGRIQQMLAAGDFKISRVSEALEHLAQTIAGARSISFRLTADQYAKLEAAGQKLGKPAHVFGRDLLLQVLGGSSAPVTVMAAPPPAPVIAAPPPASSASGLAAATEGASDEAPPVLTVAPKKKETLAGAAPVAPPVMAPIAAPKLDLPTDGAATEEAPKAKGGQGQGGDGRRWFNRS